MGKEELRKIPSVDRLLSEPAVQGLVARYSHQAVVTLLRQQLAEARQSVASGQEAPTLEEIALEAARRAEGMWQASPRPLINATGVIIHTNLGRAPLSQEALAAVERAAKGYSDLEFDVPSGERGSRHVHTEHLLCQLTGAEAAMAVNNNAAAVLLGLTAIAQGREVIVSRGEAVEIGGGFRIPDVLRQSGATLVEVGTTNRTYIADYEAAVSERTAALLKVHASNFRVVGFAHSPTTEEMVELGRRRGIPLLDDLGSGCLLDTSQFGLAHEPTPQESVAAGIPLTFFSGDKLLGGPQAGIIVGEKRLIETLKQHPLARAIRMDKLSLAALTATLIHYVKNEALGKVPVWRMIAMPAGAIKRRAGKWAKTIGEGARVVEGQSTIGGGSLPGETLPTHLLALSPSASDGPQALAQRLRHASPPVIARIERDLVLLDPRTVLPEEDGRLLATVRATLAG